MHAGLGRQTGRQTDIKTDSQAYRLRKTGRQAGRQGQTDMLRGEQADGQTDRHAG